MSEWDNAESSKYTLVGGKSPNQNWLRGIMISPSGRKRWLRLIVYHPSTKKVFFPAAHIFHFSWNINSQDNTSVALLTLQASVCQPAIFTVAIVVLCLQSESELSSKLSDLPSASLLIPPVFRGSAKSTGNKRNAGDHLSDSSISWHQSNVNDVSLDPGW